MAQPCGDVAACPFHRAALWGNAPPDPQPLPRTEEIIMNQRSNLHLRALCRATGALALSGASIGIAHADAAGQDWKGYSAVNCVGQSHNDPIRRSAVGQPGFANTGTSLITVFCPVVRDVSAGGDNRVSAVALRFNNRNKTVAGRCEFSSHDITGKKIDTKSAVAPAGSGETVLQLGPVNAHNWGSYVLSCQIPGRDASTNLQSYLINYRVDERL
jgi:hypothetical protein